MTEKELDRIVYTYIFIFAVVAIIISCALFRHLSVSAAIAGVVFQLIGFIYGIGVILERQDR